MLPQHAGSKAAQPNALGQRVPPSTRILSPDSRLPSPFSSLRTRSFQDQAQRIQSQAGAVDGVADAGELLAGEGDFLGADVVVDLAQVRQALLLRAKHTRRALGRGGLQAFHALLSPLLGRHQEAL